MTFYNPRWTTIGCHARVELHDRVKAQSDQSGLKIGQWIRLAIEEKLERETAPSIVPVPEEVS
jgi:hypothetical protein